MGELQGNASRPNAPGKEGDARGELIRLLPEWDGGTVELNAVFASGRAAKPSARAFVDYLMAALRDDELLLGKRESGRPSARDFGFLKGVRRSGPSGKTLPFDTHIAIFPVDLAPAIDPKQHEMPARRVHYQLLRVSSHIVVAIKNRMLP